MHFGALLSISENRWIKQHGATAARQKSLPVHKFKRHQPDCVNAKQWRDGRRSKSRAVEGNICGCARSFNTLRSSASVGGADRLFLPRLSYILPLVSFILFQAGADFRMSCSVWRSLIILPSTQEARHNTVQAHYSSLQRRRSRGKVESSNVNLWTGSMDRCGRCNF